MRLTIIVADKSVYKNGLRYGGFDLSFVPADVHALQWFNDNGWIEYAGDAPNQSIEQLPDWASQCAAMWDNADYLEKHPPAPSEDQLIANCKEIARAWLQLTDYAALPDVAERLLNQAEFISFRAEVRTLYLNPVPNPVWPTLPTAQWAAE